MKHCLILFMLLCTTTFHRAYPTEAAHNRGFPPPTTQSLIPSSMDISQFTGITQTDDQEGGTLITLGIPTNGKVRPSPKAPPGENVRLVTVYLPEGYNDTDQRYPVVYYLPGIGGTNESFAEGNKFLLDDLIRKKLIVPLIVVNFDPSLINGVNPDGKRTYEGCWYVNSVLNGLFEDFVTQDVIAFIDSTFRTKTDKGFRAIMGQSMGGYGATFLAMRHPDKYIGFGSASGTPFWAIATTALARPGDQLYTINSLIQPEIPTQGPNAGKIRPDNGCFTFLFFSFAGALSPNAQAVAGIPVNPFIDEFFVDLPFQVNGDGTPVFAPGPAQGAKPEDPDKGMPVIFANTLVLDNTVIDRWREKDPFFIVGDPEVVETLQEQAFYLDGGDDELINARGARLLSVRFADLGIDHEYVLYRGGHVTCLTSPLCSRHQTMFQLFSAVFSENGVCPNKLRTKIVGTGTIIIEKDAQMCIEKGTMVGIETLPEQGITETDITVQIHDNGVVKIGTDTTAGGALQVGNLFSKAKVFGDPSLANNTINATFIIDGPQALMQVGEQGFLGFGAGIIGQFPTVPNDWGMSSLMNLEALTLDIRQGAFDHNQIGTGLETSSSVFAIGPAQRYTVKINPELGVMRGGGNLASIPDGWRLQPVNIVETGELMPNGVRNIEVMLTSTNDFFYKEQMATTGSYTNNSFRKMLSSSEQLTDRGNPTPFELIDGTLDQLCTFLQAQPYFIQASKEGAIANVNDRNRIGYIDTIEGNQLFVRTTDIPIGINQQLDFAKILASGTIGIWVEDVNDQRQLIRVYDVQPTA